MLDLIYFILSAHGLTQVLVYGSIFVSIRPTRGKIGELFKCPMCMGFWVGLLLWSINPHTQLFSFDYNVINALICGWVSSATSYTLNMLVGDHGLNINFGEKNEEYLD